MTLIDTKLGNKYDFRIEAELSDGRKVNAKLPMEATLATSDEIVDAIKTAFEKEVKQKYNLSVSKYIDIYDASPASVSKDGGKFVAVDIKNWADLRDQFGTTNKLGEKYKSAVEIHRELKSKAAKENYPDHIGIHYQKDADINSGEALFNLESKSDNKIVYAYTGTIGSFQDGGTFKPETIIEESTPMETETEVTTSKFKNGSAIIGKRGSNWDGIECTVVFVNPENPQYMDVMLANGSTAGVNADEFELNDGTNSKTMANGGILNADIVQSLIADGFVNEDKTLTNKGQRIVKLHEFCFPLGSHPFSHVTLEVKDLYSKPQYVLINDTIYYTDGFLVYELGDHLSDDLKDNATQNNFLENSVNKSISKKLIEYRPYSYCPGVDFTDVVKSGEGFIVFHNFENNKELFVNALRYSYINKNYRIDRWMADSNGGDLIYAMSGGVTQAMLLLSADAIGAQPSFSIYERDKVFGLLKAEYPDLFIKGRTYSQFIGERPTPALTKPADVEKAIFGLQAMLDLVGEDQKVKINNEIIKLKKLLLS